MTSADFVHIWVCTCSRCDHSFTALRLTRSNYTTLIDILVCPRHCSWSRSCIPKCSRLRAQSSASMVYSCFDLAVCCKMYFSMATLWNLSVHVYSQFAILLEHFISEFLHVFAGPWSYLTNVKMTQFYVFNSRNSSLYLFMSLVWNRSSNSHPLILSHRQSSCCKWS